MNYLIFFSDCDVQNLIFFQIADYDVLYYSKWNYTFPGSFPHQLAIMFETLVGVFKNVQLLYYFNNKLWHTYIIPHICK